MKLGRQLLQIYLLYFAICNNILIYRVIFIWYVALKINITHFFLRFKKLKLGSWYENMTKEAMRRKFLMWEHVCSIFYTVKCMYSFGILIEQHHVQHVTFTRYREAITCMANVENFTQHNTKLNCLSQN